MLVVFELQNSELNDFFVNSLQVIVINIPRRYSPTASFCLLNLGSAAYATLEETTNWKELNSSGTV